MAVAFPKFVPLLTAYATRVSGRNMTELLSSSAALARALADTQRVVGHDGVLCVYSPSALATSCAQDGDFCSAEDFPRVRAMGVALDAAQTLRKQLGPNLSVLACVPGPAFMLSELRRVHGEDPAELADYDYVGDAFMAAVRAAYEGGVNGIGIAEQLGSDASPEVEGFYRSTRKLADFYSASFCLFLQPGSCATDASRYADYTFQLPQTGELTLVHGNGSRDGSSATTSCDVPADTAVEKLQSLWEQALR